MSAGCDWLLLMSCSASAAVAAGGRMKAECRLQTAMRRREHGGEREVVERACVRERADVEAAERRWVKAEAVWRAPPSAQPVIPCCAAAASHVKCVGVRCEWEVEREKWRKRRRKTRKMSRTRTRRRRSRRRRAERRSAAARPRRS